jgi:signal transduction histidine kinase
VLRAEDADGVEPLPGLSGLPDLVRAACDAGAHVELSVHDSAHALAPSPAVGAAAYRIVQEALTNAVRHAGPSVSVRAVVEAVGDALRVSVVDDGGGTAAVAGGEANGPGGFGITGMRERARSVGGTLEAAPRAPQAGFAVTALLPARPSALSVAAPKEREMPS